MAKDTYIWCVNDDDEFRFKDLSTHEGHLLQNGILIWFCNETAIMMSFMCKSACKSTVEGIFELFILQYKYYMQEIVDEHV